MGREEIEEVLRSFNDRWLTSKEIFAELVKRNKKINPSSISKVLWRLTKSGIVAREKGRVGKTWAYQLNENWDV